MAMTAVHESRDPSEPVVIRGVTYVRAPEPLFFSESEQVPETKRHLELRTLLYERIRRLEAELAKRQS